MRTVDVAIIGGGVIGWGVAYHVLKLSPTLRVTVIDKQPSFAMGSTARAAGGVRAQFGTAVNVDMSLRSITFFEEFERELGTNIGFRQHGYLFVTATQDGADYLERVGELQRRRGVPSRTFSVDEVRARAPFLNCDDLTGAAFSPTDGYLDPYAVCQGFEKGARSLGASAVYGTAAIGSESGSVSLDDGGRLGAGQIVLAAGHWSGELAQKLGIEVPIAPQKHQLAMTEPVSGLPENLPMIVDLDTSFHFRPEGQGLLIGYDDPDARQPHADVPPYFDFGFLERLAPVALHRLPLAARLRFDYKRSWAGYYAETPDHHAVIGRCGDIVVATGFGGHGIMHSPAAGLSVAEILVKGEPSTLDLFSLRPQRFAEQDLVPEPMVI
ncbi:MAG: FAD-binding oxidoreductase [Armatimonadetes bacterium]|nr:FAD-binding oxidoreductase [Armatimonadota bacterium]